MKVYVVSFGVAFHDCQEPTDEWIRKHVRDLLMEGCEAETFSTLAITERTVRVKDPDFSKDSKCEAWQERAQDEMSKLVPTHAKTLVKAWSSLERLDERPDRICAKSLSPDRERSVRRRHPPNIVVHEPAHRGV